MQNIQIDQLLIHLLADEFMCGPREPLAEKVYETRFDLVDKNANEPFAATIMYQAASIRNYDGF